MKLEGQVRIPSGCAISAVISREGRRMTGEDIIRSMVPMHDRSNGLGGGFAAYGIYPEHREEYAFHIFFDDNTSRRECEAMLKEGFELVDAELIPIRIIPEITDIPHIWRYFVRPLGSVLARLQLDEKEFVARTVMDINTRLKGAHVFSSGKNMGTFKAVGYPEDVGRFYRLEEYGAYSWTAHGRYPTNTPGWWGGAHPFALLDYSVVHNGEISSYDANRRYMEMIREMVGSDGRVREKDKEAIQFVKNKIDSAKWFISAIKQRHDTLMRTMQTILDYQQEYFKDGDKSKLRPMILKDIADRTGLDVSTISRVVNSKYVQTQFGIILLKSLFSEAMQTDSGEEVSSYEIKNILQQCIDEEDKRRPLTDETLMDILNSKGYRIARRTVAKYREMLGIPVARLRKQI